MCSASGAGEAELRTLFLLAKEAGGLWKVFDSGRCRPFTTEKEDSLLDHYRRQISSGEICTEVTCADLDEAYSAYVVICLRRCVLLSLYRRRSVKPQASLESSSGALHFIDKVCSVRELQKAVVKFVGGRTKESIYQQYIKVQDENMRLTAVIAKLQKAE